MTIKLRQATVTREFDNWQRANNYGPYQMRARELGIGPNIIEEDRTWYEEAGFTIGQRVSYGVHPYTLEAEIPAVVVEEGLMAVGWWSKYFYDQYIHNVCAYDAVFVVEAGGWQNPFDEKHRPGFQVSPVSPEQAVSEALDYFTDQIDGREVSDGQNEGEQGEIRYLHSLRDGLQIAKEALS